MEQYLTIWIGNPSMINFKKERVVVFTLAYLPKVIGALSDLDPAFFSFLSLNL
jgi:hypothetical protein